MRVAGRASLAGLLPRVIVLYASIKLALANGVPIEIKLWDSGRTPLAHMVDVTNGFGLKVLAEHNFLNDNNIAFSPYGLMGILVALYEGVDGESSYQIQRAMQLPWNRNVMRIGFRDIHRTLKTYFVPEEGFLAGLALNNENVTFNDNYKKILRFYGFDLDNDQLPTLPPNNSTTSANTTTAAPSTTNTASSSSSSDAPTVAMTTESSAARESIATTQMREETTPNPNAETLSDVDIRGPTTTVSPSSAPNSETTAVLDTSSTAPSSTALDASTAQINTTETTVQTTSTETVQTTTPAPPSTTTSAPITSTMPATTRETTTTVTATEAVSPQTDQTLMSTLQDEPTINNEIDASTTPEISSTVLETSTTDVPAMTTNITPESTISTMSETQQTETSESVISTLPTEGTTVNGSALETLQRRKKSIVDFIFNNAPYVDDYMIYRSYEPINHEVAVPYDRNKMFLVNGLRNVQAEYMYYDTVLEHAYLPHLEASALRLPLDSERYYLLVVLPTRDGAAELGRLLARMARESDLSDVYAAMRPRRVKAVVPSFIVRGHVTLTTDLQKLGIRDVFEPRQRDFTPMTRQPGVYVRSIEQAVSVAIRKYRPDDLKKNRYVANRLPVTFSATYPFLYFVMDASIHVALMAGKMVDPLNSRVL